MTAPAPVEPSLAPPGAGLPPLDAWFVRRFGRFQLRLGLPGDRAADAAAGFADALAARAAALDDATLARRVLVPPMRGLEDSSRNWSPGMVLEHLLITGRGMLTIALALSHGRSVDRVVRTADVKPRGGDERRVAAEFAELHRTLPARWRAERGAQLSGPTHDHPWFGPLTASDWIRLVAFHLRLHTRQFDRILAGGTAG
jgi:DinB superfamily